MNMAMNQSIDLTQIPITALKQSTMVTLSTSLNQHKVIPTYNGLPRDWRGLAQLIGLNGVETNQLSVMQDRFCSLMECWGAKGNISLLQEYLSTIDRYDILDDTKEAMVRDSLEYTERLKAIDFTTKNVNIEADKRILTVDDVIRLENGLEPQIYDAYVLYAEEDADFATEIVETMENKYNFKLCVRDRDLIGGVQFEHDAITKLIAERCRRLVVVVSSNFLKSKANKFLVTFAQALGIDIRERKVIPILYERCEVPPELSYYFLLDYNRAGKLWNFWDKLRDSIQAPEVSPTKASPGSKVEGTEKSKNDLWISRTNFEGIEKEPETKESEVTVDETKPKESEVSVGETKPKKSTIYKMIKSGFNKVKKGSTGNRESRESMSRGTSLIDLVDEVPAENFDHSSGFDVKDEKEKSKKKKWYKKRAVETLLS